MTKNVKSIFLVATLLFLLVGVSAISASEVSDDNTIIQDTADTVAPEITTSDKIVDTTTKNIKTEEQSTDLYVSDTDGSDDNSGTNTSPYKTIQKALNSTTSEGTYNIYLTEGTYKGLGNTNLTVNGNSFINFIGTGNAVIDGEVNYTEHVSTEDDYFWGSSKVWEPYDNGTGNWALKITKGNGLITIKNLTIQNCWNPGGSSIDLYDTCTIDNYANLEVNNVKFIFNHGGVGASIRNNNAATIIVNNSLFDGNRKSSSTGNYGAGIYNNGTATIINSIFQNNYARWGTITTDKKLTIINSTIQNNYAYDGGSTYKTGSGITVGTGGTDFYANETNYYHPELVVDNCVFINNQQADIYGDNIIVNNSIFNKSSGLTHINNATITNNIIDSPIGSTIGTNLGNTNTPAIPLDLSTNNTVINNTLLNNDKTATNSYDLRIYTNNTILNNNFTRLIYIHGNNNQFKNNNVTTTFDAAAVEVRSRYNNITDNYLVSTGLVGDEAVSISKNLLNYNNVSNNYPQITSITLSEENFNKYFRNNQLKNEYHTVDAIIINGTFENHDLIFDLNHSISITRLNFNNYNYNVTITIKEGTTASISQLTINNTDTKIPIILESANNSVTRNTIQTSSPVAISANTTGNTITGNKLYADINLGNNAVSAVEDNTVSSNTPTYSYLLLNDDTYPLYFDEEGNYNSSVGSKVYFMIDGILSNKTLNLKNSTLNITKHNNESIIYNTTLISQDKNTLILNNVIINNTNKLTLNISTPSPLITDNTIISNTEAILIHDVNSSTNGNLRINANNITITGSNYNAITAYNVTSYGQSTSSGASNIYKNTINMNGDNITAILIYNSTFSSVAQNTINAIGTNVVGINITNDVKQPLNATISNRGYLTTTIVSNNVLNIQADNNAVGLITENLNIHMTAHDLYQSEINKKINFNITSNNTLTAWKMKNVSNTTSWGQANGETTSPKKIRFNLNANNKAVAISAEDYCNILADYLNITIDAKEAIAVELINTTKEVFSGKIIELTGKNSKAFEIINSTDIVIKNMEIYDNSPSNNTLIDIKDSNMIYVESNTILSNNWTVAIYNSNNSRITNNLLYAGDNYGDNTILSLDNNDVYTQGNKPTTRAHYLLNNDTYNDIFDENGLLNNNIPEDSVIELNGNISNKNITLNKKITINKILDVYLLNTTLTLDADNITLNNLKQINYDKNAIIINSNYNNINNITIQTIQSIEKLQVITINGDNNILSITKTTTEQVTNNLFKESTIIAVNGKNNNIHDTSSAYSIDVESMNKTTVIHLNNTSNNSINFAHTSIGNINDLRGVLLENADYNNINMYIASSRINGTALRLINSSNNNIQGTYGTSGYTSITEENLDSFNSIVLEDNSNYNNISAYITQHPKGNIILLNNSHNNLFKSCHITSSSIDRPIQILYSNNNEFLLNDIEFNNFESFAINISEGRNNSIHHNQIKTKTHQADLAVLQEVVNETKIQNPVKNNYYQTGSGWDSSPYNPLKTVINSTETMGYVGQTIPISIYVSSKRISQSTEIPQSVSEGILEITANNEKQVFDISQNEKIVYNYTITDDTLQQIIVEYYPNSTNYEPVSTTLNISIITVLTDDNYDNYFTNGILNNEITAIELGSDLYNKELTFTNTISFLNPYNYTLYNPTIYTGPNTLSNLIINNNQTQSAIHLQEKGSVTNSTIIHESDNTRVITFTGISQGSSLTYSKITITGKNNIVFSGTAERGSMSISYNNINITGNKTIISDFDNQASLSMNNINIETNNTNLFKFNRHITNQLAGAFTSNNLTVTGNNITIVNATKYQFASLGANNIKVIGDNITTLAISDLQKSFSITNNNITINTTTPHIQVIFNESKLTFTKNNILLNSSQNNIPIITATDEYPVSVTNNYIESLDLMGNNAVSGATTITNNKPNGNGEYKVIITTDKDSVLLNKENTVKISVHDMYNKQINGTLTATVNNKTVEVINDTITFIPTRSTYEQPTIEFSEVMENQTITTVTRPTRSTYINNCVFNLPNTVAPSYTNALCTSYGQTYVINNTILNTPIYQQGTIYFYNCTINGTIGMTSGSPIYIDESSIIGEEFKLESSTKVYTNNKQVLDILEQNNMMPQNNPQLTITFTDPEGKYETTTLTKILTTTTPTLTIDPITATAGETINITARITAGDDTLTDINKGKVTFKVNGKTLKDTNGKVIYAKVVNGVAIIENYLVPDDWAKDGTTIQAVYSGSTECNKLTSEKTNITVAKAIPTLTTTDVTAAIGETITLTATITDNDKVINTGKIVFKINGKTVKDANGKVIYAKVVNNQVNVEYTLPADMKAKDYNITATFISSDYERMEDTKTLTVTT